MFFLAPKKFEFFRRFFFTAGFVFIPIYFIGPKITINMFMKKVRARNAKLEALEQLDVNQLDGLNFSSLKFSRIDNGAENKKTLGNGQNFIEYFGLDATGGAEEVSKGGYDYVVVYKGKFGPFFKLWDQLNTLMNWNDPEKFAKSSTK
jgi:hypothetical protein